VSLIQTVKVAMARGAAAEASRRRVLNVGGGSKSIAIPAHYDGWDHLLLDIDPKVNPDVLCDARELTALEPASFDAVYCSHNLEHYYPHDGARVLQGFKHVLNSAGFAEIRVPDIASVMRACVERNMDVNDVLYMSPGGPISARDVLYGWEKQIRDSGNDFYAHKTGFTAKALTATLERAGFRPIFVAEVPQAFELCALAFAGDPQPWQKAVFGL